MEVQYQVSLSRSVSDIVLRVPNLRRILSLDYFCAVYVIVNLSPKLRRSRITFQTKGHKKLTADVENAT